MGVNQSEAETGDVVSEPTRRELAEQAVRSAEADRLVEALDEVLRERWGVRECDVLLVDLRLVVLEPVLGVDGSSVPLVGTAAGRCFNEQTLIEEKCDDHVVLHVPLTVRGDRMGVLRLVFDEAPPVTREETRLLAACVAEQIHVADVVTDRYRRTRRPQRLTLAAEMQWQLLPVRAVESGTFRLAGQLEPAYAVRGDNFDWIHDGDTLSVAVTNGMGESVTASMLTTLAITALRNARRGGADLAGQAMLADQAVWSYHGGDQHVSTLFFELDLPTGRLRAIDAGSPQLWRVRGEEVERIELEAQLPLGMLGDTEYQPQEFHLEAGDRLWVLTDGVYEATLGSRQYARTSLHRVLRASRLLPPPEAVRALLSDLRVFLEDHELDDDAVAVCLDWHGPR